MTAFDPDHLPILGEPLPVEFANTWYNNDGTMIDFLATRDMVTAWFAHCTDPIAFVLPELLTDEITRGLREVRNSIYAMCASATTDAPTGHAAAVVILNRVAALAASHLELRWADMEPPTAATLYRGTAQEVLLARLASDAISFFAGPDRGLLRRCATPSCEMFFVQRHHRRRFCSEPCSQRTRQSRYYRNHHTIASDNPGARP